jgi:cytidylate kinase
MRKIELTNRLGKQVVREIITHQLTLKTMLTPRQMAAKLGVSLNDYWNVAAILRRWDRRGDREELLKLLS